MFNLEMSYEIPETLLFCNTATAAGPYFTAAMENQSNDLDPESTPDISQLDLVFMQHPGLFSYLMQSRTLNEPAQQEEEVNHSPRRPKRAPKTVHEDVSYVHNLPQHEAARILGIAPSTLR